MEDIKIQEEQRGDILLLRIEGKLDAVSTIETQLLHFIDEGWLKVIIDFSHVDYISSAGMRMLLAATKKLKNLSGNLVLFDVNTVVAEVLALSGFDKFVKTAKTEEEAMEKAK